MELMAKESGIIFILLVRLLVYKSNSTLKVFIVGLTIGYEFVSFHFSVFINNRKS